MVNIQEEFLWSGIYNMNEMNLRHYTRSVATFQRELESRIGKKLMITFNHNISTMLSVRWVANDYARVSLHHIFLEAPQHVMEDLAFYLSRKDRQLAPTIKEFIEKKWNNLDYSHLARKRKLIVEGTNYNLQQLYNNVNETYFENKLDYSITWYGQPHKLNRSVVTFGLFHAPLKLIKINRILDKPTIPDEVISFVIYHEMLHGVCPSYVDEDGFHHIHSKEFKEQEERFHQFQEVRRWIKKNKSYLFAK